MLAPSPLKVSVLGESVTPPLPPSTLLIVIFPSSQYLLPLPLHSAFLHLHSVSISLLFLYTPQCFISILHISAIVFNFGPCRLGLHSVSNLKDFLSIRKWKEISSKTVVTRTSVLRRFVLYSCFGDHAEILDLSFLQTWWQWSPGQIEWRSVSVGFCSCKNCFSYNTSLRMKPARRQLQFSEFWTIPEASEHAAIAHQHRPKPTNTGPNPSTQVLELPNVLLLHHSTNH